MYYIYPSDGIMINGKQYTPPASSPAEGQSIVVGPDTPEGLGTLAWGGTVAGAGLWLTGEPTLPESPGGEGVAIGYNAAGNIGWLGCGFVNATPNPDTWTLYTFNMYASSITMFADSAGSTFTPLTCGNLVCGEIQAQLLDYDPGNGQGRLWYDASGYIRMESTP